MIAPRTLPNWPPLLPTPADILPSQPDMDIAKSVPPSAAPLLTAEIAKDEVKVLGVDTENGHDSVYLLNAAPGSRSFTLLSEDDPKARDVLPLQAELALMHLRRAERLAAEEEELLRHDEPTGSSQKHSARFATPEERCDTPGVFISSPEPESTPAGIEQQKTKFQVDHHLRDTMRCIKLRLLDGMTLMVERMGSVNLAIACAHPQCPAPESIIQAGAYYIVLGKSQKLESAERWCLTCLESLWNGKGMLGALPMPDVGIINQVEIETPDGDTSRLMLDGMLDGTLMKRLSLGHDGTIEDNGGVAAGTVPYETPRSSTPPDMRADSVMWTPTNTPNRGIAGYPLTQKHSKKDDSDSALSPLTRKAKDQTAVSKEASDLMIGFGEAFLNGQVKVARKRGEGASHLNDGTARRSTRLQTLELTDQVTAPLQVKSPYQKSTKSATPKPARTPSVQSPCEDIVKAENKLDEMYRQRNEALRTLRPGQSALLRAPRSTVKHRVSIDELGVPYTDLLGNSASRYHVKDAVREYRSTTKAKEHRSTLLGPVPDALREPGAIPQWHKTLGTHLCSCYGNADESPIIRCSNEQCLIGLYHVGCVGELEDEEDWRCRLCSVTCEPESTTTMQPLLSEAEVESLFPQVIKHTPKAIRQDAQIDLPQLDGLPNIPSVDSQQQQMPPSPAGCPRSLLASKHAPPSDDLAYFPLALQYPAHPPSPPHLLRPETPRSPYPDPASRAFQGLDPPKRFQYVAQYIRIGNSLGKGDKRAVNTWKAASEEQMGLILREDSRVAKEVEAVEHNEEGTTGTGDGIQVDNHEVQASESEEKTVEACAGVARTDCHGKDLTDVLAAKRASSAA